jgi:integrase/recombinase XerD
LVRDHVKASGVAKDGACHLFRHTLATVMLEGGADIRYVQAMLGHAELSTTQIYAQVSIRALQAVHRATHPAALRPVPPTHLRRGHGVDDDGEPEQFITTLRASPRELLAAALDQEIEEENRGPAGSNSDLP